jgi:hypothetical protein
LGCLLGLGLFLGFVFWFCVLVLFGFCSAAVAGAAQAPSALAALAVLADFMKPHLRQRANSSDLMKPCATG